MKRLILSFTALVFAYYAMAQKISEKGVPAAVKTTMNKLYPHVSKVKWEKEKGNFEANFKQKNTSISVLIDPNGNLIETETSMPIADLPFGVVDFIKRHYPGASVTEAALIKDSKGIVKYEAEVQGKDLLFDSLGNPLP